MYAGIHIVVNMTRSSMNSKTLRYLMKHSDIGVLLIHTHLGLEDAKEELKKVVVIS